MNTIDEAIAQGIKHAQDSHLTKSADVALAVEIALDNAGFKIVRKPGSVHPSNFPVEWMCACGWRGHPVTSEITNKACPNCGEERSAFFHVDGYR